MYILSKNLKIRYMINNINPYEKFSHLILKYNYPSLDIHDTL